VPLRGVSLRAGRRNHGDTGLDLVYRSRHPFAELAHGLIGGCRVYSGEALELGREDLFSARGVVQRIRVSRRPGA
jgi:hypothetical protein